MMRKIAVCLTVFALAGAFTGCNDKGGVSVQDPGGDVPVVVNPGDDNPVVGDSVDNTKVGGGASFKVVEVEAQPLIQPVGAEPALTAAATGANDFAFRLGAELAKSARGRNFVFSPYSVWMPLAALVNAVDATHKDALLTALGASGVTEDDINRAASRMLYYLTKAQPRYGDFSNPCPLKIANAIFVDNKVTLRQGFAQVFMDYYRGSSINVDFLSPAAAVSVNNWASENTEGLITKVIDKFDSNTVAAIANAIYFSDRWESEFDSAKTAEGDFHAASGDSRVFYMRHENRFFNNYYEDDRAQAVTLSFKQGGGMCVILPKPGAAGADDLYASMTNKDFAEIRKKSALAKGNLSLPRFSIDNDVAGLLNALKALGVPLFDNDPITNLIEEDRLAVTSVSQKAVIKVDEKGTTAAAVTVIGIGATSVPQPQGTFEMICDKPFLFVLYDRTYDGGDQILFTGVVNKP